MLCQILEKVSPNPAEAKAVAAQRSHQKNRSMEFPPGTSTVAITTVPSPDCVCCAQWTDGVCFCMERTQITSVPPLCM